MSYFKIDLSTINAGLTHQTGNLRTIINYCFTNNLKLIKPNFILYGLHNNNTTLKTDLSMYYDLNSITVDGKLFKLYDDFDYMYTIKNESYKDGLISNNPTFQNLKWRKIDIPYKKNIIDIANEISVELGEYMCIHVRRGDRITNEQIDIDTQPNNIMKVINEYKPKKVYIMTNKLNELKSLANIENIYFHTNFDVLNKINDNYYLFCIENNIMKFAKIRCSTFNVNLKHKNNNYYHCYLTNYPGWQ